MIERPSFLAEHVTPDKEIGSGAFVDVVELASVSKEVAEQVPTGFVLKQYRPWKYAALWLDLFRGNYDMSHTFRVASHMRSLEEHGKKGLPAEALAATIKRTLGKYHKRYAKEHRRDQEKNPEEYARRQGYERRMTNPTDVAKMREAWSLPGIATQLRERHESLKAFFTSQGLPELIVPTNFVVGRGKGPYVTEEGEYIYEVQPKVHPVAIPKDIARNALTVYNGGYGSMFSFQEISKEEAEEISDSTSKEFAEFLKKNLVPKHLQTIQREFALLHQVAETLPQQMKRVPSDIFNIQNLVITKEGLRIVDTNQSVPFLEDNELQKIAAIEKENRSDDQYALLDQQKRYWRSVEFLKRISEQLKEGK